MWEACGRTAGYWAIDVNKRFLIFLAAGLAVVGALIFVFLTATAGAHLRLEGKILKVRVLALPDNMASLVVVDFRATNPSDVLFVGSSVTLLLDPASGPTVEGTPISKPDVENIFRYEKLLGPQFNPVYSLQDKIPPHDRVDRMTAARFDLPASAIDNRKALRIRIEDVDGAVAEFGETK
jgi:hypothetical protein